MVYKVFKQSKIDPAISHERWSQLVQEINEMDVFNQTQLRTYQQFRRDMLEQANHIWGTQSKEYRTIARQKCPQPPDNQKELRKLERRRIKHFEKFKESEQRRQYRQRQKEAVLQLEKLGFIEGEDFRQSNAITFLKRQDSLPEPAFPLTDSSVL